MRPFRRILRDLYWAFVCSMVFVLVMREYILPHRAKRVEEENGPEEIEALATQVETWLHSKLQRNNRRQNATLCDIYKKAKEEPHVLFPNVLPLNPAKIDPSDVTLVLQCSLDRAKTVNNIMERWLGPVSIAVYLKSSTAPLSSVSLKSFLNYPWAAKRNNVFLHSVTDDALFYPVNYMRNVALNNSQTTLSLLLDCDFVPSINLYEHLKTKVAKWPHDKHALVIPAFEYLLNNTSTYPMRKHELIKEWSRNALQPFHLLKDGTGFHSVTDFEKWKTATQQYKIVEWIDGFEPYILVKTKALPQYDERFVGRLRDKMSFFYHLHFLDFKFEVDHAGFVLHLPHPKQDYSKFGRYYRCAEDLYISFKDSMPIKNTTVSPART